MINLKAALAVILLASTATAQILSVQHGGTGNTTLTQHGPLVGNGTGPVTAISPGTAGQCLISGGPSVDPVFAPCPGGVGGGPGAGSCSVNQYVNALINGSPPTCSQITYQQLGGTVPTWNQSTTGNAATATALFTSGTANQVWGMDSAGTAQGWRTPSGTVGSAAWSSLTPPTTNLTLNMGGIRTVFNYSPGSAVGVPMFLINNPTGAPNPASKQYLFGVDASQGNSNIYPIGITVGSGGFEIDGAAGNLRSIGTSKVISPVQLPIADAPALGTDANGNIIAGSGGGPTAMVYNGVFAMQMSTAASTTVPITMNGPGCVNDLCTMVTPSTDTTYTLKGYVVQTANGVGCTAANPNVSLQLQFNAFNPFSMLFMQHGIGTLQTGLTMHGTSMTGTSNWSLIARTIRAKAPNPVNIRVIQVTASDCSTPPTFEVRVGLFQEPF